MKKLVLLISLFISLIYLSSAIDIVLNSWEKLDNSSWTKLSWVLNKVDINSSDLNINWKLSVDWKICDINNNCLWECKDWKVWDNNSLSCIPPFSTPEVAGKTCDTIYASWTTTDWNYYLDPDWEGWVEPFQAYCDMRTDWGWTMVFRGKWNWTVADFTSCVDDNYINNPRLYCINHSLFTYAAYIAQASFWQTSNEVKTNWSMNYHKLWQRPSRPTRVWVRVSWTDSWHTAPSTYWWRHNWSWDYSQDDVRYLK